MEQIVTYIQPVTGGVVVFLMALFFYELGSLSYLALKSWILGIAKK